MELMERHKQNEPYLSRKFETLGNFIREKLRGGSLNRSNSSSNTGISFTRQSLHPPLSARSNEKQKHTAIKEDPDEESRGTITKKKCSPDFVEEIGKAYNQHINKMEEL